MASPPSSQVIIEAATILDAAVIAQIGRETFEASFGHSLSNEDMQAYFDTSYRTAVIEKDIANPSNSFIVAREAPQHQQSDSPEASSRGPVIGFLQLKHDTTEPCLPPGVRLLELHRIYMATSAHGRGTGKLLMDEAHAIARREGFLGLWLGVWEENLRAQRFYEKHGYQKVGVHDFVTGKNVDRDNVLVKVF